MVDAAPGAAEAVNALPKPGQGRIVRLLTDDEEEGDEQDHGAPTPFLAFAHDGEAVISRRKREPKMPKGVYERKPRGEASNDAAPTPQKRRRKARALTVVKAKGNGAAPFAVALDLRAGAVTINAANGSLTLAPDEVLALFAFIGRR